MERNYKNVFEIFKKNKLYFIFGPLIKIIEVFVDLAIPLFMKAIIDLSFNNESNVLTKSISDFIKLFPDISDNTIINYSLTGGLIIFVIGIIGFCTTMVTQFLAAKCASIVGHDIRSSLYNNIMQMNKKEINLISSSKIQTILNNDSYQAQQGVLFFIRLITRTPFIIIGSLIISFILNYKIGFLFLALVPIIIFIIFFFMGKSSTQYLNIQEQLDVLSKRTTDNVSGSKVIKVFNKENLDTSRFQIDAQKYLKESEKAFFFNSFINPLTFAIVSIIMMLCVITSYSNINQTTSLVSPSTLITLIAYLNQIFQTVIVLTNLIVILVKSNASIKRINIVLSFKPSIIENNGITCSINKDDEFISFNDVSFNYYDNSSPVVENINFKIFKGQTIGIIGGIGSGKSTLALLMAHFIDPSKGTINYKGSNIKNYSLKNLRSEIGYAFQKSILFKGSIKSNLLMANKSASDDDLTKALKDSLSYEFVNSFKKKLDHEIIEGGNNLSGGQKQRINIARALIKKPELLILDDSTSALDLLSESKVKANIFNNYPELTKVIISQRISTIKDSDLILVLDSGKIVSYGKHNDLLKTSKIYKEIYSSQVKNEN